MKHSATIKTKRRKTIIATLSASNHPLTIAEIAEITKICVHNVRNCISYGLMVRTIEYGPTTFEGRRTYKIYGIVPNYARSYYDTITGLLTDKIVAVFKPLNKPMTVREIADASGFTQDRVMKCLRYSGKLIKVGPETRYGPQRYQLATGLLPKSSISIQKNQTSEATKMSDEQPPAKQPEPTQPPVQQPESAQPAVEARKQLPSEASAQPAPIQPVPLPDALPLVSSEQPETDITPSRKASIYEFLRTGVKTVKEIAAHFNVSIQVVKRPLYTLMSEGMVFCDTELGVPLPPDMERHYSVKEFVIPQEPTWNTSETFNLDTAGPKPVSLCPDLETRDAIIKIIAASVCPLTSAEIAKRMGISAQQVYNTIYDGIKDGLIERGPNTSEGRRTFKEVKHRLQSNSDLPGMPVKSKVIAALKSANRPLSIAEISVMTNINRRKIEGCLYCSGSSKNFVRLDSTNSSGFQMFQLVNSSTPVSVSEVLSTKEPKLLLGSHSLKAFVQSLDPKLSRVVKIKKVLYFRKKPISIMALSEAMGYSVYETHQIVRQGMLSGNIVKFKTNPVTISLSKSLLECPEEPDTRINSSNIRKAIRKVLTESGRPMNYKQIAKAANLPISKAKYGIKYWLNSETDLVVVGNAYPRLVTLTSLIKSRTAKSDIKFDDSSAESKIAEEPAVQPENKEHEDESEVAKAIPELTPVPGSSTSLAEVEKTASGFLQTKRLFDLAIEVINAASKVGVKTSLLVSSIEEAEQLLIHGDYSKASNILSDTMKSARTQMLSPPELVTTNVSPDWVSIDDYNSETDVIKLVGCPGRSDYCYVIIRFESGKMLWQKEIRCRPSQYKDTQEKTFDLYSAQAVRFFTETKLPPWLMNVITKQKQQKTLNDHNSAVVAPDTDNDKDITDESYGKHS